MSTLLDTLLSIVPRERAGALASNRFEYQRSWTLCHVLNLHTLNGDYVVLLEYHDDIVVLDSEQNPTSAEFIQVKTAASTWTEATLLSQQTQAKSKRGGRNATPAPSPTAPWSVLGKLFHHSKIFGAFANRLHLVSNMPYDLPMGSGHPSKERANFCLDQVCAKTSTSITTKLQNELSHLCSLSLCHLNTTDLSKDDHDSHSLGKLCDFIAQRSYLSRVEAKPLHKALQGEIKRRSTREQAPSSTSDLLASRGLSRREFQEMLLAANSRFSSERVLQNIRSTMQSENMSFRFVSDFSDAWITYEVDRMDLTNLEVQTLKANARSIVSQASQWTWSTLDDLLRVATTEYHATHGPPSAPFNDMYLRAALMWEHNDR